MPGRQYGPCLGGFVAKYRQHGYQDSSYEGRKESGEKPRKAPPERKSGPPKWDHALGPRPVNLPGTRAVSRCAQCGTVLQGTSGDGKCPKCGFELHSCKQCTYFDPGSRFECMQPVKERVAKKDARNECPSYEIRVTREKETSTPASLRPNDARAAFENLFKK
jgi:phage FluMu protein Com